MGKHDFLNQNVTGSFDSEPLPPGAVTDVEEVEGVFEEAFWAAPRSDFLVNVYDWWEAKGFLTEAQFEAVKKFTKGG